MIDPRDALADRMHLPAVLLVDAVHTRNAPRVRQLLADLDGDDTAALLVVLAAMVDQDKSLGQMLEWTADSDTARRSLLEQQALRIRDQVAAESIEAPVSARAAGNRAAMQYLNQHGMSSTQIAAALGLKSHTTVLHHLGRLTRDRHALAGAP